MGCNLNRNLTSRDPTAAASQPPNDRPMKGSPNDPTEPHKEWTLQKDSAAETAYKWNSREWRKPELSKECATKAASISTSETASVRAEYGVDEPV